MKLKEILRIHDRYSTLRSLPGNLGDGYLLQMNPLYRRVREEAILAKFSFTPERFWNYDTLALTELPRILSTRTIPYLDNVKPLREIETKAPGVFSLNTIPPLKGNQLFHESTHALAHELIARALPTPPESGVPGERELVFRVLLEESFANACESIANLYSHDEVHNEFLFKNSYVMEDSGFRKTLQKSVITFGLGPVFRLTILSFLHANFLKTGGIEKNLIRSIRLAFENDPQRLENLSNAKLKLLAQIFKAGLLLDPEFTQYTNRFCLRLLGIKTDLKRLFQFDFLAKFEKDQKASHCLNALEKKITLP